jgi:SAM-dependent methyltransferase
MSTDLIASPENAFSCRICGNQSFRTLLNLERAPRCISRLLSAEQVADEMPAGLQVHECRQCRFVQSKPSVNDGTYDDYIMSWMHLRSMRQYRESLCADYVREYALGEKRVLDVGCGSGEFLEMLAMNGATAVGIEPSRPLSQLARVKGYEVIQSYVAADAFDHVAKFDGITCLQVLEHLEDPLQFLKVLRSCLTSSGVALLEVPSLEKILEDRRLYEFFVDHVNYFTVSTLTALCESAGFQVRTVRRGFEDQFLIAVVSPGDDANTDVFAEMRDALLEARQWVQNLASRGLIVAAWGAGYKSTAALAELDLDCLTCVIDSDSAKHGLFTPVSHLQVRSPEILRHGNIDAVLITAVGYKKEILSDLRNQFGFKGPVAALSRRLEIL